MKFVLSHSNHFFASYDIDGGAAQGVSMTVPIGNHNDDGHGHDSIQQNARLLAFRNVSWVYIRQRIRTHIHLHPTVLPQHHSHWYYIVVVGLRLFE